MGYDFFFLASRSIASGGFPSVVVITGSGGDVVGGSGRSGSGEGTEQRSPVCGRCFLFSCFSRVFVTTAKMCRTSRKTVFLSCAVLADHSMRTTLPVYSKE